MEMVGAVNGVLGINYCNWNGGGSPSEFTDLSNLVAGQANQVLALTRRDPNIMNITGLTGLNEQIFTQNGSTLTAIYPDGNSDAIVTGALAAARPFARRKRKACVQGAARDLQLIVATTPHARLIHRQERWAACG
jgi:hypothetical protein